MSYIIKPFQSIQDFYQWRESNCVGCMKAHIGNNHVSSDQLIEQIEKGTECDLKASIMLTSLYPGRTNPGIESAQANRIGYHSLYGISKRCKEKVTRPIYQGHEGNQPKSKKKKVKEDKENQLELF